MWCLGNLIFPWISIFYSFIFPFLSLWKKSCIVGGWRACFILLGPLSLPFSGVFSPFPSPLHVHFGPCSGYVSIFRALASPFYLFIYFYFILFYFIYLFIYFVQGSFVVSLFTMYFGGWRMYVCCACRTQCDGMVLRRLMHYDVLSLCRSLWPQNLYLSRVGNQHGHWACWMSTSRRTV